MFNYEVIDKINDIAIYNGTSKKSLVDELFDYIEYQNHIDEEAITDEQIRNLDQEALEKIGIKLYINKW